MEQGSRRHRSPASQEMPTARTRQQLLQVLLLLRGVDLPVRQQVQLGS